MGLVADESRLAEVPGNYFHRLAIELAKTVNTVTRATAKSIEQLVELLHPGVVIEFLGVGFRHVARSAVGGTQEVRDGVMASLVRSRHESAARHRDRTA